MRKGARGAELFSGLLGLLAPPAVAVAWVPIRSQLPNVDLALLLVVLVAGIGAMGRRSAVVVAACSAALWFEFFDTAPFEHLDIARNPDVETTLVLAFAGFIVGEMAVRVRHHRRFAKAGSEDLATVHSVASLVASGEELVRIIEAVVADLTRLLQLDECWFEATPSQLERYRLDREARISPSLPSGTGPGLEVELPVEAQGETLGHFVLRLGPLPEPEPERLRVALTLAAALGGAFLAQAPPPLPPERRPVLPLRLIGGASAASGLPADAGASGGPEAQETSGFSCAAGSRSP